MTYYVHHFGKKPMALSYKIQASTVKIWLLDCLSTLVRSASYSLVTKS